MAFFDEVNKQLGPTAAVLRPASGRVIECLGYLVGLCDQVARFRGWHRTRVTLGL